MEETDGLLIFLWGRVGILAWLLKWWGWGSLIWGLFPWASWVPLELLISVRADINTQLDDHGRCLLQVAPSRGRQRLISFRHITWDSPLAADYLRFISFLSEKNIPKSLLPVGDDGL